MVLNVIKQPQRKGCLGKSTNELCTSLAKQSMNGLYTWVKQLPMEYLCNGVRQLQLEDMG